MTVASVSVGSYQTNCYLLTDEKTKESAVVDCGVYTADVDNLLKANHVTQLKYILLTHGHFDHICGVKALQEAYGGRIAIHEADAGCLTNPDESLNSYVTYAPFEPVNADILLSEGSVLSLGNTEITVWHTPGHTRGSVCFLTNDILFSGDTLFYLSMGRTDMPGGSTKQLFTSLKRLGETKKERIVYPGHGQFTSLSFEKQNNRYLRAK